MSVSAPGSLETSNRYEATMYLMTKEEGGRERPISANYCQVLFSQTWSMGTRIDVPESQGSLLMPGDHATVHVTLHKDMYMDEGQRFTVREGKRTVASGVIAKRLPAVSVAPNTLLGQLQLGYKKVGDGNDEMV